MALSSLQSLKSAALTVQLEESADNMDALIEAAQDVAHQHGLTDSPSKRRMKKADVDRWIDTIQQEESRKGLASANSAVTRQSSFRSDEAANDLVAQVGVAKSITVDDAVSALANEIGVKLKPVSADPATNNDDDAIRLMAPHPDNQFDENIKPSKNGKGVKFGISDTSKNRDHIRYMSMRKSTDNKNETQSSSHSRGSLEVISRPSKVSRLLDEQDNKSSSASTIRTPKGILNESQELLFREMKLIQSADNAEKKKRRRKFVGGEAERATALSNRLFTQSLKCHQEPNAYELLTSAGKKKNIDEREKSYSRFEDAKECTFKPRIKKSAFSESSAPADDEDGPKVAKKSNFIERQEAAEKGRRDKIELSYGKQEYEKLLDKKFCPRCKAKQSYDDIKEKRKKCNNCNVEYTTTIEWNKVRSDFYLRQQAMLEKVEKKKLQLAQELEREERVLMQSRYDRRKGKIVVEEVYYDEKNAPKWDDDMEHDFFERMKAQELKRQQHLKRTEDEMYAEVGTLSISGQVSGDNDFYDYGSGSKLFGLDPATAFLYRYEEDLKRRNAIKAEQRRLEKERKEILSRTFEESLVDHPTEFRV